MTRQVVAFDHNRLLKTVAAQVLEPLGLYQVGRSRTWVDDHGWWVTVVSFGPSGFGRGTYLDVGVSLLWKPTPMGGLTFDTDLRKKWKTPMGRFETQFIEARHPDWFERDVRAFGEGAIEHLSAIRARRNDLHALAARLDQSDNFWDRYHRAVARGLVREAEAATADFATVIEEPNPYEAEWLTDGQASAESLVGLMGTPAAFDSHIAAQVSRCRREARLRSLADDAVLASLHASM
jgi:hypothetical protein